MEDITEKEALYILRNTNKYSQIGIDRAIRKILQINKHRNNGRTKLKKRIEKLEKENKELKISNAVYVKDNDYLMENSIPKSVIREKIEDLYNKQDKEDEILSDKGFDLGMRNYLTTKEVTIKVLKELLGEEK